MRNFVKNSGTLRRLYYRMRMPRAQSDEAAIIDRLTRDVPRTFVEFGFHPTQFNCIDLARNPEWRGLLIDGNERQVEDAKVLLPNRLTILRRFLTLDNLDVIKSAFAKVGVLSIDVDGNDYWFLRELISIRPAVISVEYNASFGLAPITVPYDEAFDRMTRHPRAWYHGASLTALAKLCAAHGYGLAAVSSGGLNAFFTADGSLDPAKAWLPNTIRERSWNAPHDEQWAALKDMTYISV